MKKLLLILLAVLALVVIAYLATLAMANRAEAKVNRAFRSIEPDQQFLERYPAIGEKSESTRKLESLAHPLGVELRPQGDLNTPAPHPALDSTLRRTMADWIQTQLEASDDSLAPLPEEAFRWLEENRRQLNQLADHLVASPPPSWPLQHEGSAEQRPVPNLMGHMTLWRLLTLAALEAERRGDRQWAWRYEHASWMLARGLLQRPELTSRLVGLAGVRFVTGTARKLEPPVPPWMAQMNGLRLQDSLFDAVRHEWSGTGASLDQQPVLEEDQAGAEDASVGRVASEIVWRPLRRLAVARAELAALEEISKLRGAGPCEVDSRSINMAVEREMGPLARRMGAIQIPNLAGAFARAAATELAIEGTEKILRMKELRLSHPEGRWPQEVSGIESSICRDAQWQYQAGGDGLSVDLRFSGNVDRPEGFRGVWLPLGYSEGDE